MSGRFGGVLTGAAFSGGAWILGGLIGLVRGIGRFPVSYRYGAFHNIQNDAPLQVN